MRAKQSDPEAQPLLAERSHPEPEVITGHQKSLDKKLHTYLLIRALGRGYLPSTDQSVNLLRKLLGSAILARNNPHLTTDGKKFIELSRKLVSIFIELLRTKNGEDQIQRFLWLIKRARLNVDFEGLGKATENVKTAHAKAAYNSLSTITNLLMANSDFNKLFSDGSVIFRQVISSSAHTAAEYTNKAAEQIEPSNKDLKAVESNSKSVGKDVMEENQKVIENVEDTLMEGVKQTGNEVVESFQETMTPERENAMKRQVRSAISNLRRNTDYNKSVSTVSILLKNYLMAYSTALQNATDEVTEDIQPNSALTKAGSLLWSVITSFGKRTEWEKLQAKVDKLMSHKDQDVDFEQVVTKLVDSLYSLFTDPDYLLNEDGEEQKEAFSELKEILEKTDSPQEVKNDMDAVIKQMARVWTTIGNDIQIRELKNTSVSIGNLVLPTNQDEYVNHALLSDLVHVLIPLALQTMQYVPIPRVTLTSPDVDLLLEPIILEPGKTVNHSSFLPYNVSVVTTNEIDIFKGRSRVGTGASSTARIKVQGLTVKAEDVGYVMNLHKNWFLRLSDSGVASFRLDERGMDVFLDLEFTRSSVDHLVMLKGVSVKLHKLDFNLSRSKFSFLAWIMRPFIRPILRKLIQDSIRDAIETALRAGNRELIYTRERLRATRIADPSDMRNFIKAVLSRWQAPDVEQNVDFQVRMRSEDSDGRQERPFDGVYAPGSLVGLIETEGLEAGERVEEGDQGGWRNDCFNL